MTDKMDYIFAVEEEQNLTRAAKRLYIAQSTLTMYLNRLEAELGVKLFDRSQSPILPTPAGQLYLRELRKIQKIENNMRTALNQIAHPQQVLKIGIGPARSCNWMPRILPAFQSAYPDVTLHIIEQGDETLLAGLHSGKFDVIIGTMSCTAQEKTVELSREPICLLVPKSFQLVPGWLMSNNSPMAPYTITPDQLDKRPVIIPDEANDLANYTRQMLEHYQIEPGPFLTVSTMNTAAYLVAAGLGYLFTSPAFLPARDQSLQNRIAFCTMAGLPTERKLVACYRPDSDKAPLAESLVELLYAAMDGRDFLPSPFSIPDYRQSVR